MTAGITDAQHAAQIAPLLQLYQRKFPIEDIGHAIRSLAYFGDADAAPLPRGLGPDHWALVKRDVARWVKAL